MTTNLNVLMIGLMHVGLTTGMRSLHTKDEIKVQEEIDLCDPSWQSIQIEVKVQIKVKVHD